MNNYLFTLRKLGKIKVTDEKTTDSETFEPLVENLNLKNCLADGAYDHKEAFELLEEKGVGPPGIKTRKNTRRSLSPRGQAVKEFQKLGYEKWKKKHEHGKRWAVEGFFSAIKRCFGETVRATTPEGMTREVKRKFGLYNLVAKL